MYVNYCILVEFTVFRTPTVYTEKLFPVIKLPWSRCSGHKKENQMQNTLPESVK